MNRMGSSRSSRGHSRVLTLWLTRADVISAGTVYDFWLALGKLEKFVDCLFIENVY